MLLGCDLSENNGVVNWYALAPAIQFVILRISNGIRWVDKQFENNLMGALAHNVPVGVYYERDSQGADWEIEAATAAGLRNFHARSAPIALGMEDPNLGDVAFAKLWAQIVADVCGAPPILYLDQSLLDTQDWAPLVQASCGLWLAQWDGVTSPPQNTGPWPFAAIKQYIPSGSLPGIAGAVDLDVFYGDVKQFALYG